MRIPLKRRNDPEEGGGGDTVTSASYAREMLDDLLKLTQGGEGYARVHACLRVCAAVCECMHACMPFPASPPPADPKRSLIHAISLDNKSIGTGTWDGIA